MGPAAMKSFIALISLSVLGVVAASAAASKQDPRCFEMRTYYASSNKLDELQARFRDHTMQLFEKHGMVNIGYWTPLENPDHKLIYILAYPDRLARETAWVEFGNDPAWKDVVKKTEAHGRLVRKVDSVLMEATDFSPRVQPTNQSPARVFELRTYTAAPDKLPNLLARFREHTLTLFKKHGLTSFGYWTPLDIVQGSGNTLIYILAHPSQDAAAEAFKNFRADPAWVAAKKASEDLAGGSLTVPDGVKSVFMAPTDYSPTK